MNRNKRISTLTVLLLGLIIVNSNLLLLDLSSDNSLINNIGNDRNDVIKDKDNMPRRAIGDYYSSNFYGTGNDINITLHQSIINEGTPLYEITDFDDVNNRTFQVDCPKDTAFNSIFSNITVMNISAPNKTLNIDSNHPNVLLSSGDTEQRRAQLKLPRPRKAANRPSDSL